MKELWADIPGFDQYMISDLGRVRNWKCGTYLRVARRRGEPIVYLREERSMPAIVKSVSVLVGQAFNPDWGPEKKPIHLDNNPTNNRADNLMWQVRRGEMPRREFPLSSSCRKRGKKIRIVETGEVFPSQKACAEHIGGREASISECLKGRRTMYLGYTFARVK